MTAPVPDHAENEQSFVVLNAYLEQLHAGVSLDREQLLAQHPGLAEFFECLDALEELAVPPNGQPRPSSAATAALPEAVWSAPGDGAPTPIDFGKYELLCELGRGGMGVVYKARQKDLDRPVAIKMILASHLASVDCVNRFHDEARAAAGLHHPHIVAIYEAGQIHGQPYFAMQYIAGPSLADVLTAGPLAYERAAQCVASVARAVAHLHAKGFVHRDIKPSNILLDENGQPYVTDFGLVKWLQTDSHRPTSGAILGNSLGAILYESLTGRPPFRAATPLDTIVQVIESEPVRPRRIDPRIPHKLEVICLRCLEKAPAERYASAQALADDLERYLNGETIEATGAGPITRLNRWTRREPALASRLIVLAACCAIIQINYSVGGRVPVALHIRVMLLFAIWGLLSVLFQRLLNRKEGHTWIPFAWAVADMVVLTVLLIIDEAINTPFLIAYPCLIAASGLWFRVALVWFTTFLSVLSYAVLVVRYLLQDHTIEKPHQNAIFIVALFTLGFIIAYQVRRVRALSRYYEHRPLP